MRPNPWAWLAGMVLMVYFATAAYGDRGWSIVGACWFAYFAGMHGERVRLTTAERAEAKKP